MNDEERFVISPKGLAMLAARNAELIDDLDDVRFEAFWLYFDHYMHKHGYIEEELIEKS
jgi:hypothetical protein